MDSRKGREKVTNWFRVSLWGKRAESLSPYLLKGSSVTVTGEFSLDEYDGKPQLNIRANDIALQGGKQERSVSGHWPDTGSSSREEDDPALSALDDDCPF